LDHAARSASESLELAKDETAVLAGLLDRRFLWGDFELYTALDNEIRAILSGPDAGSWWDAIGSALSSTRCHAPREVETLQEPDIKLSPGGLRDLRRALLGGKYTSGCPTSPEQASLIEARRFLWLVRCHLHFLAGRAEDRLATSVQPCIARRLGLDEPHGCAPPPLLGLFRYHASNVLAAIGVAPHKPLLNLDGRRTRQPSLT
jgi:[protein-PII] uridylyltransferase